MYLALRWLIALSLTMWVAMCCIDFYFESGKGDPYKGFLETLIKSQNITNAVKKERIELNGKRSFITKQQGTAVLHYVMFFAGALAVSVFNRKKEIILYTTRKLIYINICTSNIIKNNISFKRTVLNISVAIIEYVGKIWEYCRKATKNYLLKRKMLQSHRNINLELLKKVKEYAEGQKKIGQLLISTIRENKNIRMRYQIETTAKNRLLQYIEDTQKQMKENRSKYVSFQHLYLVTHQENIFLNARLKKVSKEKEEAENNLLSLVNEVYQSKNKELKAYCTRFIVRTREKLLNCDVKAEIQKFLRRDSEPSCSYHNICDHFELKANINISEVFPKDETLVLLEPDAPKLKGLPGECIWTVKDKDGIIEKLYECDYETDFDKGDTIRRIRKYTVYHDEDCLLDSRSSKLALYDISETTLSLEQFSMSPQQHQYLKVANPKTCERFLTGSQAFQKFLQENLNLIQIPISKTPAIVFE